MRSSPIRCSTNYISHRWSMVSRIHECPHRAPKGFDRETFGRRRIHALVDFWHTVEKLAAAAKVVDTERAPALLARWRLHLLDASSPRSEILRDLVASGPEHVKVGEKQPVHEAITYLTNNAGRMDYARARCEEIVCHSAIEGAVNAESFVQFVRKVLAPRLRPGDILVLDNLRPHKDVRVRETVEAVGAGVLYLPPYSPDMNPIEPMWSWLKAAVRAVGPRLTVPLKRCIRAALKRMPPEHLRSWFEHCGYFGQANGEPV